MLENMQWDKPIWRFFFLTAQGKEGKKNIRPRLRVDVHNVRIWLFLKFHPSFISTSETAFVFDKNNKIKNQIKNSEKDEDEESEDSD